MPEQLITNRTIDEIKVGDSASLTRKLTQRDIEVFAALTGDVNPVHVDAEFARDDMFHQIIGHGMWGAAMISAVLGTELPGPGTIYCAQTLRFRRPVHPGDTVTATVTVTELDPARKRVMLDCTLRNQQGDCVIEGTAEVRAPTEKIRRPRWNGDDILIAERGAKFDKLIGRAKGLDPIATAVVHPVEPNAIAGAIEAARAGLIAPVLVGPEARIRAAAEAAGIDLAPWPVEATEHSHAAAETAARMAHEGRVQALMKGSLHTDEFLHPILAPEMNLRTARRLSHVFLEDVPSYPKLLLISDGAINIAPDLDAKKDIVENAIEMAQALGIEMPKVAILSAVEVVNPRIPSTLDAAALCKMAERGQITGGVLDGPLAFDNAVSALAAKIKHIESPVVGQADILIAPDLEAGNMISKQLEYLAGAEAAGVVMGARVPIILTSRADSARNRMASCAVATMIHAARHKVLLAR